MARIQWLDVEPDGNANANTASYASSLCHLQSLRLVTVRWREVQDEGYQQKTYFRVPWGRFSALQKVARSQKSRFVVAGLMQPGKLGIQGLSEGGSEGEAD